ncbi:hypothetical protein OG985_49180 (plasmid) [Streptomyces sp. NBC_00289]|uniref:hypothetical protein n=1 Tax=Streptomyces sp. NBC_00289 TaxID=2975703 RepID=UPI003254F097
MDHRPDYGGRQIVGMDLHRHDHTHWGETPNSTSPPPAPQPNPAPQSAPARKPTRTGNNPDTTST